MSVRLQGTRAGVAAERAVTGRRAVVEAARNPCHVCRAVALLYSRGTPFAVEH